ncbi:MAG: type II toxin-antitoxin system VapC family toxin [Thermoproteota archaeon]|nr:type II toxin-antitoxin system VapC family toxin [Candidatus Brockarchaeota archaeon]
MPFVDSNIFIYHLAADPVYGKTARKIIERIENGEESYTSTLVIAQVCSYLKWKKRPDAIPLFLSFLKGLTSLQKIETSILDFEEAGRLQKQQNLPWSIWDDIVIAAQMKRINVKEIYSNDKDFDKIPLVKRLFLE